MENTQFKASDECRDDQRIPSELGSTVIVHVDDQEIVGTIDNKSDGGLGLLLPESSKEYLQDDAIITLNYSMPFGLMSQQAKICWLDSDSQSSSDQEINNDSLGLLKVGAAFLETQHSFQTDYQKLWQDFSQAGSIEQAASYWLSLQCALISGVTRGVVVLGNKLLKPGMLKKDELEGFTPISVWPKDQSASLGLTECAELCLQEKRGILRDAGQFHPDLKQAISYISYPLMFGDEIRGVVAIEMLKQNESSMRAVMRQLQWGGAWMELFVHRQVAKKYTPENQPMISVLELIASTLAHEKFQVSATAVITEIATLLKCERVSIGFTQGDHIKVLALSHSADFSKKSALIQSLGLVMDEAMDQEVSLVYPALENRSVHVLRYHEKLVQEQNIRSLCTIPLSLDGKVYGAITLERSSDFNFDQKTLDLCETIAAMVGPILNTKYKADRSIPIKFWHAIKDFNARLFGTSHAIFKLITTSLLAAMVFGFFAVGDYRVSADTTLEGATQRVIVSPFDGFIDEAYVRAGDRVKKNMSLVKLEDKELLLEKARWQSQVGQYTSEYRNALGQDERSKVSVLKAQLGQAKSQLALVNAKLDRANIKAPFEGIVVSGDLSQSLGSPAQRGEILFEIAPLDSYRIILEVDEREIANIQKDQSGELVLSGLSDRVMPFTITRIMPVSISREGRNFFRVEAAFEQQYDFLRPGMSGVAKVMIDQRRMIHIWSKELLDWSRLTFWTWWPD